MNLRFILLFLVLLVACGRGNEGTTPLYKDLIEAVYASGNVYPQDEYTVMANATGVLQQRLVNEGDTIRRGQLLFVIDNAQQDAQQAAAATALRQSRANLGSNSPILAELETSIRNAQTRLLDDSLNAVRYRNLYAQNATTRVALERAELSYTLARNTLRAQQSTLARTRNQLRVETATTRSQLVTTEVAGRNTRLRSLEDGLVYDVYKRAGEVVRPGDPIALLGRNNAIYARLAVDESDFGRIKPGQTVLIKADLTGDKLFTARIYRIYPKLNRADQSFRADAEFVGEKPSAYYGLTIEANIIVNQHAHVLTIPKSYVIGRDSVWIDNNGTKQKVRFEKGAENFDLVEVKGGLSQTSKLIVNE